MPFLELSVRCRESEQPRYERALEDIGALAVTLLDADAATGNERAILEPGVGETPLWHAIALAALFPADADGLLLLAAGLAVLSQQYEWAEKRVDPIFERAKQGAVDSGPRFFTQPTCHHAPEVYGGLEEARASELLIRFFKDCR